MIMEIHPGAAASMDNKAAHAILASANKITLHTGIAQSTTTSVPSSKWRTGCRGPDHAGMANMLDPRPSSTARSTRSTGRRRGLYAENQCWRDVGYGPR